MTIQRRHDVHQTKRLKPTSKKLNEVSSADRHLSVRVGCIK